MGIIESSAMSLPRVAPLRAKIHVIGPGDEQSNPSEMPSEAPKVIPVPTTDWKR